MVAKRSIARSPGLQKNYQNAFRNRCDSRSPFQAFEGSLGHMTLGEVMRAVPKMAALGMLDEEHDSAQKVIDRIQEQETILAERLVVGQESN